MALVFFLAGPAAARAQPSGGQVVAGSATFSAGAGTFTITQTSARAIIDWQDFSIAAGGHVKFFQPDAASATLNRVVSNLPSSLAGTLEANGQVYLINPNGIVVGAGARIDTGGFLAATLEVADNAFLAGGDLKFSGGSTAAIKNLGAINALGGDVFLIARQVENSGAIAAANGTAGLAAGSEILLTTGANERLFVQAATAPGALVNAGTVTGATAELKAAGGNAYALAINNSGVVRATGSAVRDGQVWLVASGEGEVTSSGTVAATGESGGAGGTVRLLGDRVTLTAGAVVDVSGAQGGGTALIGGDFQGKNSAVRNAQATTVATGAKISADAITSGNGGKVIVWADGVTDFGGDISARGGAAGGDGGFAEVSGKSYLAYRGLADLRAPFGSTGTLLLDPTDVTITGAGSDATPTFGSFTGGTFDGGANNSSTIFIGTGASDANSTLLKQLASAAVVITTTSTGAGTGNINVNAAIAYNSANSLTLTAGNTLTINSPITNAGAGGIVFNAGGAMGLAASVSSAGTVTLNQAGALTQTAGTVSAATLNLNGLGAVGTSGAPLAISSGTVVLNKGAGAGAGFVNDSSAVALSGSTGGGLTFNSDSGISINQNLTTAGVTTLNADKNNDGAGTLTVASGFTLSTTNSALTITAADFTLSATNSLNSGTAAMSLTASNNRSIGLGGTAGDMTLQNFELGRITASSLSLNTTGLTGDMTVNGINFSGTLNTGPVTLNAGGTVTFASSASTFYKGISVNANDGIAVGADLTATNGNIVLDGDANSTATPGDGIAFTGTRTLTTGIDYAVPHDPTMGSITLRNGASGTNGNITSAALNLRTADNVNILDDVITTGATFSVIANNPNGANGLNSVDGRFTLASGKTISTVTSGDIEIMSTYVDLLGSLNSVGIVNISGSRNMPVNLGAPETQVTEPALLTLTDAALGRITATGLTIGVESTGLAAIYVKGLTAANTDQFGTLTLTTPGFVGFEGTSVIGNRLTASGAGGIVLYSLGNLSTSTAATADPDLSLSGNNLLLNTAVTITAGGTGTLTLNPSNSFSVNGSLTLESGDGLAFTQNFATPSGFQLTLNADKNNDGVGTLSVANGVTLGAVGGAHMMTITAADVILNGTAAMNSGSAPISITASGGRSAGLGATVVAGGLNISGSELQQITATGLTLTSFGNITVDGITEPNSNNIAGITTLAANGVASTVTFVNTASTFNALTVNSATSIANNATLTLDVGNLVLNAGTTITQIGAIEIGTGTASLSGTTITLTNANNTLGAVTVNSGAGDVSLREDSAVSLAGITRTSGNLTLNAATDITQTGPIAIATGAVNLTAANITLTQANTLGAVTINAGTGNVALTIAGAMAIAGIAHTGTVNLTAAGAITDSGALTVTGTTTLAAGATNDITLDNANDFSTVVVTSGKNVTLNDVNALALGNVTAAGSLLATAAGDLTVNTGATIAATGAVANPLVLVAGGNFINNVGAAALNAGTGRWLVYSTSPAGSTENGLTAAAGSTLPRLYNRTFAANAPATIAAGNHLIYSSQPTLTVTAGDQTRVYGDANGAFTATIGGFLVDDGVTDTTTTAGLTGSAALSSLATAASPVSGSPYAITAATGTLASGAGYGFGFVDGALTVSVRPITVTAAAGQTKVYGSADPGPFTFANSSLGGGVALTGSLARAPGENVASGPYAITQGTVTATNNPNYSISYVGNTFAITPATLTYAPDAASRLYGASNPSFTGTVTGFANGESRAGATTGTLVFGSAATTASNVGTYAITGSGLTANNGNYVFSQASGPFANVLTVNPATLIYAANAAVRLYGAGNPVFSGTVTGFANGETQAGVTTGTLAFASAATTTSNVGAYAINGSGLTANNGNYVFTQAAGNATALTINPVTLTYTANTANRLYGASNPAFSGTVTGFANGETQAGATTGTLAFASAATTTSNVGRYAINGSGLTANNGNYLFTQAAGNATALTINPATLTYVATAASRLVGASDPAFSGAVTGFANGETPAGATTGTLGFGTTATNASPAGSYPIDGSGLTANHGNYVFVQAAGNATAFTIGTQSPLTITADSTSKTYGAALPAFTASFAGFINGDTASSVTGLQFSTTATASSNVGTYTITPFGATAPAYYLLAYVPGTLTINPASLTISANSASRTYGATNPAFSASFSGLVNGDTSGVVTGLTFGTAASPGSNVGTYAITPANGTAANYTITNVAGTLTINPAALTITADNQSKIYGAALPAFTASYSGFVNGDTPSVVNGLTLTTPATAASGVGTSAITPANGTAANYTITNAAGSLTITPAPLTITADGKSRAFGVANPALTATYTGLVNNDTTAAVSGLALATTALLTSPIGSYPIAATGATSPNYAITFVNGLLAVGQNLLTITADSLSKIYGAALPAFTASYAGLLNGDTPSVVTGLQFSTTATAGSNVGTFAITPFGGTATSYTLAYVPGTLTINPATLTYVATPATRFFGAGNPAFSGAVTGFIAGESPATATTGTPGFGTTATVASSAGSYPINGSGLTANHGNYVFVQAAGNATAFTIGAQTPLTIAADNKTKTYGAALPAFTASYAGLINGDTASSVTGLQFSTTATAGSNVGTFTITPFGATAPAYYLLGYVPGTLTINPASLLLTANNATRVYGTSNPVFGASFAGLVNGDTAAVVTGLQLTTPATSASGIGSYAITPSGAAAANYTIAYAPGALAVTPAALTVTAASAGKTYGAANPAFGATFGGLVNGDTAAVVSGLTFTTAATAGSGIGAYAITPAGAAAANYALTFVPGTLTINPASLTITAGNAAREFGAANPAFSATYGGFVNGDTAAVISGLAFTTPATATSPIGDYAITPLGATAANYALTFVNGTLHVTTPSVSIVSTPTPVTIINQQPVIAPGLAVINSGDRLVLVPINSQGNVLAGAGNASTSLDSKLTVGLSDVTSLPRLAGATSSSSAGVGGGPILTGGTNFGSFDLVTSLGTGATGGGLSGNTGGLSAAQITEPGLYRESSVNMGGYKIIYHEALADARQQAEDNTAQGSSYREFLDTENPRVDIVRATPRQEPGDESANPAAGRKAGGTL